MIWTLELKLFQYDNENNWKVSVEVDSLSTLEDLHYLIQYAVDFQNPGHPNIGESWNHKLIGMSCRVRPTE